MQGFCNARLLAGREKGPTIIDFLILVGMECQICLEEVTNMYPISLACDNVFCTQCITNYLHTKLQNSYCILINCLCGCDRPINHEYLNAISDLKSIRRDYELYFRAQRNVGSIECQKCRNIVLKRMINNIIEFVCIGCEHSYCPRCRGDHDTGSKCIIDDLSLKKWITDNQIDTDMCPSCGIVVTRDGCKSVQCSNCNTNFIWQNQGTIRGSAGGATVAWHGRDVHDYPPDLVMRDPIAIVAPRPPPVIVAPRPPKKVLTKNDILHNKDKIIAGRTEPYRIIDLKEFATANNYALSGNLNKKAMLDRLSLLIREQ